MPLLKPHGEGSQQYANKAEGLWGTKQSGGSDATIWPLNSFISIANKALIWERGNRDLEKKVHLRIRGDMLLLTSLAAF